MHRNKQGISLYSYLYFKLAKTPCLAQVGEGRRWWWVKGYEDENSSNNVYTHT
jgi:hypothetical protein